MLINNQFDVAQPVDKVWEFFGDVPQVAACLPGAELTEDLGDDTYGGGVGIRMGPVKLQFAGKAKIVERDDTARADGHRRVRRRPEGSRPGGDDGHRAPRRRRTGTKVSLDQDLQLSGAAAQYGRGMISDVTTVLMGQFATNVQQRIDAIERGESLDGVSASSASGLSIGAQAGRLALMRVFRRFFSPTNPPEAEESTWSCGGSATSLLLVVVVPVLVALLNRVLAALERIRGAADDILAGGGQLAAELDGVPEALATTDAPSRRLEGAARYAGLRREAAARPSGADLMPVVAWVTVVLAAVIIAAAALGSDPRDRPPEGGDDDPRRGHRRGRRGRRPDVHRARVSRRSTPA